MPSITEARYTNEAAARKYLERMRWPDGPVCPHCGSIDRAHKIKNKAARPGLWFCAECRKQFTVTVGTLYERSKIPLHKWLLATHFLCSSKKGMSAHQLHRMLGVTYKTAWFMAHRIREAMREPSTGQMGGNGATVEVDETYIGGKRRGLKPNGVKVGVSDKEPVVALVERGGRVRSMHVPRVGSDSIRAVLRRELAKDSHLRTDQAMFYRRIGEEYLSHERVNHGLHEYVRGDAHTQTVEGYFSILKRGINGVYHHVSVTHLKRYLGEFDFRYNYRKISDAERAVIALKGIEGKRLTYRRIGPRAEA